MYVHLCVEPGCLFKQYIQIYYLGACYRLTLEKLTVKKFRLFMLAHQRLFALA
jgi:hypothetical protein